MKKIISLIALCCVFIQVNAQPINNTKQPETNGISLAESGKTCSGCCCNDNNVPAGIMAAHTHSRGEWMVSYTYMNMMMQGNRMGTAKASDNTVYDRYMMSPETMTMQMHMLMVMYGVTNRLTLMAMGGYGIDNMNMNMSDAMMNMPGMVMTAGNMSMQSSSSGITDTRITALYNFSSKMGEKIIGGLGISAPTGSIKATGTTMLGDNQPLPYDMQLGTGSVGLLPDFTYLHRYGLFSYGANIGADINVNDNSLGYRIGNMYHANVWVSYRFLPFANVLLRAEGIEQDKIHGANAAINIPVLTSNDPTTNTVNYGGKWASMYAGINLHAMNPAISRFSLLVEYGVPVYQNLNGVQMSLHANVLASLQYAF